MTIIQRLFITSKALYSALSAKFHIIFNSTMASTSNMPKQRD